MIFNVHLNVENDFSAGWSSHKLYVPPLPPPAPTISIEMIATMMHPPGYVLGQNKLTTTVKHKKMAVVQDGHNCGVFIQDITIPPVNAWYLVMWPLSSRKTAFCASTVRMNKKPVACTGLWPPLPMVTCGEPIKTPTAFSLGSLSNTVTAGMTLSDLLSGAVAIYACMAVDAIAARFLEVKAGSGYNHSKELLRKHVFKFFPMPKQMTVDAFARAFAKWSFKKGFKALIGLGYKNATTDPTFKASVGNPYVGISVEEKITKGELVHTEEFRILGARVGVKETRVKDKDGNWVVKKREPYAKAPLDPEKGTAWGKYKQQQRDFWGGSVPKL